MLTTKAALSVIAIVLTVGAVAATVKHNDEKGTPAAEAAALTGTHYRSADSSETSRTIAPMVAAASCVCYAHGTSYQPGSKTCIGGRTMICSDRPSGSGNNCGWASPNVSGDPERC